VANKYVLFLGVTVGSAQSLRQLADQRGIRIGAAAAPAYFTETQYRATLSREFNQLEPENAMKFGPIHPGPTTYDFDPADALVNFAMANNMAARGHTLVCDGLDFLVFVYGTQSAGFTGTKHGAEDCGRNRSNPACPVKAWSVHEACQSRTGAIPQSRGGLQGRAGQVVTQRKQFRRPSCQVITTSKAKTSLAHSARRFRYQRFTLAAGKGFGEFSVQSTVAIRPSTASIGVVGRPVTHNTAYSIT
jgi:hypothetical protein